MARPRPSNHPGPHGDDGPVPLRPDLADVLGQAGRRKALEISAAGGHHLSLTGPAGTGKTMLAERLPSILPTLDLAAALEVTAIHSVAGMLAPGTGLITVPPFIAPHHTCSMAAIADGGAGLIRPEAASLGTRGVLFLYESRNSLRIHCRGQSIRGGSPRGDVFAGQRRVWVRCVQRSSPEQTDSTRGVVEDR